MKPVAQLVIEMAANVARLEKDMAQARRSVDNAMNNIRRSADMAMKALGALGIGLSAAGISNFVRQAINAGDEMSKMAQRIGVTTQQVAGLQLAFEQGGSTSQEMQGSISRLTKALADGNDGLKALKITSTDTVGALGEIANAFQNMPDGAQKTALAVEIFGRSGANLIPILNQGAKGLQDYDQLASQLGITIDTETGRAFEKFNDTLDTIGRGFSGFANQLATQLIPSLQAAADTILEFMLSLDFSKIAKNTIDTLTVLVALVAGRMVAAFASFATSMIGATASMTAMGVAAGALRGIMALLGGPVGVIASATALLYTFREELGLTAKTTYESEEAIQKLKNSVNELSVAQTNLKINEVWDDLLKANKNIADTAVELERAKSQLEAFTQATDPMLQASLGSFDQLNNKVVQLTAALEIATNRGISLQEALQTLGVRASGVVTPKKAATQSTINLGKATKDVAKEMRELIAQYEFETEMLTKSEREKEYANFLRDMEKKGIKENTQAWREYTEAFMAAQNERQFTQAVIRQNEAEKKANEQRIADRLKKEEEFAREMEQINNQIGQSLTDALMSGGMNAKEFLINMFKTLVLRPILQPIITGVTGALMSGFAGSAMAQAGGATSSMAQSAGLLGAVGAVKTVFDGFMGGFQALGASFTNIGVELGSQFIADFGYGFGQGFTSGSGVMANSGAMLGAAANAAAGIAGGIALGNLISGNLKIGGSQYLATGGGAVAGAIIGSIVPGLGTALGAIIGGALGGVINRAFGTGPREVENAGIRGLFTAGGTRELEQFERWTRAGGWFSSRQRGMDIRTIGDDIREQFDAALMGIGISVETMVTRLGQSAANINEFSQFMEIDFKGMTPEQAEQRLTEVMNEFSDNLTSFLIPNIAEFSRGNETANQTLVRLYGTLTTVNNTFEILGYTLYEASLQGAQATQELVDLFGGLEKFTAATTFYYENFYSAQEKVNFQTEQLTKLFGALNLTLPDTRDQFRDLVEAAQAAGDDVLFANLIQLAPAFNSLRTAIEQTGSAAERTAKILRERQTLEVQYYKLQGDTVELRRRELEGLDESNRALQEQIWAIEDATDSVNRSFDALKQSLAAELNVELDRLQTNLDATITAINVSTESVTNGFLTAIDSIKVAMENLDIASNQTNFALSKLKESLAAERDLRLDGYATQYNDQKTAIEAQIEAQRELEIAASDTVNSLQSLFDVLQNGIDSLYSSIDSAANVDRALAFITQAVITARSGGILPSAEAISGAISIATSGLTSARFSSAFEMRRSNMVLQNELMELQGYSSGQLTVAEKQLKEAKNQVTLLESQLETLNLQYEKNVELANAQHEQSVAFYQLQVDELRGIDNSVLNVDVAVRALNTAMVSEQRAMYALQESIGGQQFDNQKHLIELANLQVEKINLQIESAKALQQEQIAAAQSQYEQEVANAQSRHNEQLGYYQKQIDQLFGVDNSVKSVEQAIRELTNAMSAIAIARATPITPITKTPISTISSKEKEFIRLYDEILERAPDKEGLDYWLSTGLSAQEASQYFVESAENRVQEITRMYENILDRAPEIDGLNYWVNAAATLDEIRGYIESSTEAQALRGFANGGYYPGGMALVGERGPELIDFSNPGMVYTNNQLRSAMSSDAASEIRALREDNQAQSRAMVALQNRMTRLLERWDGDGLPEERMVEA